MNRQNINLGTSFKTMATEVLLDQQAQHSIKARAMIYNLKALKYVYNVKESWLSITNRITIGATCEAPSMIRKASTIELLQQDGWKVVDKWPDSKVIYIAFKF